MEQGQSIPAITGWHGQVDHRVLQNRVLNARLAQLVAKLGILRDVQAAIVNQNGALGLLKLLPDVGHDALLGLDNLGHFLTPHIPSEDRFPGLPVYRDGY